MKPALSIASLGSGAGGHAGSISTECVIKSTWTVAPLFTAFTDSMMAPAEWRENTVAAGERPVVMFGPEASGMETDEVARADAILTLPVNPGFASLNLANAVAVFAYAYAEARQETEAPVWFQGDNPPATQEELDGMFAHLEQELEHGRFFHPMDKAPLMRRNLRSLFMRTRLTQQEVQTMRGVIKALTIGRGGRKKDDA